MFAPQYNIEEACLVQPDTEFHRITIELDASGNAYVTGLTWSADFPTLDPYQGPLNPGGDLFVSKFSPDGVLHYLSDRTGWWNLDREDGTALSYAELDQRSTPLRRLTS